MATRATHKARGAGLPGTIEERLLRGVDTTQSGCWEWSGYRMKDGYGMIWGFGRSVTTHRASYSAFVGPIPDGLHVLHSCDNPPCINPEHLFLGSNSDNVADMVLKGRVPHGETHHLAKLTDAEVLEIREAHESNTRELAERYGVSRRYINQIISGERRNLT